MKFRAATALVPAILLAGCGLNSVPTAEEEAKAKWADVQTNYQRRADLIPNLVATVKGAAGSEGKILNDVVSARARATQVQVTGDDLTDSAKMSAFNQAQNGLTLSLQRMQEAYPQLQSQGNFTTLMSQLEGTENRIAISIRDYNGAVQAYNTRIRTFPDAVGAKIFYGAKPMTPFQAQAGADKAPTVDFGNTN
ncbi:LemA family protein [Sphingomonas xinjiangensis]|uniref:LemA protein n=1 Tax=Sphingomonas xinjiangensis TaxID=643568 RepID=A0A840YHZ1_9SPHN|nr:LemA family protein [Sphingomonas xinjiangensis]MBB5711659.1 LemA protein [Sphingomonas xinjiangensis]